MTTKITDRKPVERGQIYRHYKGGVYTVLGTALHTETQETLVLYKSSRDPRTFARPETMFLEGIDGADGAPGFRFTLVGVEDLDFAGPIVMVARL